jgi:tetratricopeptide (TPR) repeat protein
MGCAVLEMAGKEVLKARRTFDRFPSSMSREHIDRKTLKRPDSFVAWGQRGLGLLFREKKVVAGLAVGILLVAAGFYAYGAWTNQKLNKGWVAYHQAEEATGAERVDKWKKAYEVGGNSRAAYISAVALADHYFHSAQEKAEKAAVASAPPAKKTDKPSEHEDPEPTMTKEQVAQSAADWYTKALGFSLLLDSEKELLTLNLGQSLELLGQTDAALEQFQKASAMGGQGKALAILHVGRMLEAKNDVEGAKKTYQGLVADFAMSEYARIARNYLRRMDSRLLSTEKL